MVLQSEGNGNKKRADIEIYKSRVPQSEGKGDNEESGDRDYTNQGYRKRKEKGYNNESSYNHLRSLAGIAIYYLRSCDIRHMLRAVIGPMQPKLRNINIIQKHKLFHFVETMYFNLLIFGDCWQIEICCFLA